MIKETNEKLKNEASLKRDGSKKDIDLAKMQFEKEKDRY